MAGRDLQTFIHQTMKILVLELHHEVAHLWLSGPSILLSRETKATMYPSNRVSTRMERRTVLNAIKPGVLGDRDTLNISEA